MIKKKKKKKKKESMMAYRRKVAVQQGRGLSVLHWSVYNHPPYIAALKMA